MQQPLDLDAFIQWEGLPSLPSQLTKIIDQVATASSMDYDIVEMIKYDASIACRILKLANSALYGYAGKISSLQQACGLLGLEMIKNIVFTTPAVEFYQGTTDDSNPPMDYSGLWKSLAISATIAEWLGIQQRELDANICYAAGLIQGIGKIALAVSQPALLKKCHRFCKEENTTLEAAENFIFGFSHLDVGLRLATAGGYPSSLIDIFKYQNNVSGVEVSQLSDTIHLAKFFTDKLGYHDGLGSVADTPPMSVWSGAKFNQDELKKSWTALEELANRVSRRFTE